VEWLKVKALSSSPSTAKRKGTGCFCVRPVEALARFGDLIRYRRGHTRDLGHFGLKILSE
jgi:hypothetical protein